MDLRNRLDVRGALKHERTRSTRSTFTACTGTKLRITNAVSALDYAQRICGQEARNMTIAAGQRQPPPLLHCAL